MGASDEYDMGLGDDVIPFEGFAGTVEEINGTRRWDSVVVVMIQVVDAFASMFVWIS